MEAQDQAAWREPACFGKVWHCAAPAVYGLPMKIGAASAYVLSRIGDCVYSVARRGTLESVGQVERLQVSINGDQRAPPVPVERLLARVAHIAGYSRFSLTRASAVVNCQSALA
jgi:hypothetical protein